MQIRNISPRGALEVPLLRTVVEAGAVVDVTPEQAERLLDQHDNWQPVVGKATNDSTSEGAKR